MKLELGTVVVTKGISDLMNEDYEKEIFILESLKRYSKLDWGDTCNEDAALNDKAVKEGNRVLAVYEHHSGLKIFIITEWDRSATTILLPSEY